MELIIRGLTPEQESEVRAEYRKSGYQNENVARVKFVNQLNRIKPGNAAGHCILIRGTGKIFIWVNYAYSGWKSVLKHEFAHAACYNEMGYYKVAQMSAVEREQKVK